MIVYLIGAYLRKYPVEFLENGRIVSVLAGFVIISGCGSVFVMTNLIPRLTGYYLGFMYWLADSYKITSIIVAVVLFCWFKSLRIGHVKWINVIAQSTFGVLLIHANSNAMRHWLWIDTCRNVYWYTTSYAILHLVFVVLMVYVACTFIDLLRRGVISYFNAKLRGC